MSKTNGMSPPCGSTDSGMFLRFRHRLTSSGQHFTTIVRNAVTSLSPDWPLQSNVSPCSRHVVICRNPSACLMFEDQPKRRRLGKYPSMVAIGTLTVSSSSCGSRHSMPNSTSFGRYLNAAATSEVCHCRGMCTSSNSRQVWIHWENGSATSEGGYLDLMHSFLRVRVRCSKQRNSSVASS